MQLELFQRNGVKKLENKIHIYELDCYKNATEEQKKRMRVRKDRYFDLEGLPSEEVRKLLEDSPRSTLFPYTTLFRSRRFCLGKGKETCSK